MKPIYHIYIYYIYIYYIYIYCIYIYYIYIYYIYIYYYILIIVQKMFHIDDPTGRRKANFERALGVRCRNFRTKLKARYIERKKAPKEGNPNANKQAWEIYAGYISKEQWERFEDRVASAEFKVFLVFI